MVVSLCLSTCGRYLAHQCESIGKQMMSHVCARTRLPSKPRFSFLYSGQFRQRYISVTFRRSSSPSSFSFDVAERNCLQSATVQRRGWNPLTMECLISNRGSQQVSCISLFSRCQNLTMRLSLPKHERKGKITWKVGPKAWVKGGLSAGFAFGLCLGFPSFQPVYAKGVDGNIDKDEGSSPVNASHGKRVYTDYSITGIPGDGRCLFRSVAHGACLRSGKPSPDESLQRELADELRARVSDEFVKRRKETEWFVEGDFDTYVEQIRKPHVWGGEPELFMASHVLQLPITVFMYDETCGGLIAIAEYGQEYGKENPVRVLYHGFGHYDALQIPGKKGPKSRL